MTTLQKSLLTLLSDSYALYRMAQTFHWNVTGPNFASLHALFEQQYTDLAMAIDEMAERLRALDVVIPVQLGPSSSGIADLTDADQDIDAEGMVRRILAANTAVANSARSLAEQAEEANDPVTADMGIGRAQVHEKMAWMLKATLQ